jgi:hypothetical protein
MKSLFRRADRSFGRKLDVVLALIRIYLSFIHSKKLPSAHSERLRGGDHDTRGDSQETQQIRPQDVSFDHQRR